MLYLKFTLLFILFKCILGASEKSTGINTEPHSEELEIHDDDESKKYGLLHHNRPSKNNTQYVYYTNTKPVSTYTQCPTCTCPTCTCPVEIVHCGINEHYNSCGNKCHELCNSQNCPDVCESGCWCKNGFKRIGLVCAAEKQCVVNENSNGQTCPSCPENEEFSENGNYCLESCESVKECPQYRTKGCFCKIGYRRDSYTGKCDLEANCPSKCASNEQFSTCGNSCLEQCNGDICPTVCETGCWCKPGFKRIGTECQPQSNCNIPESCKANEVLKKCGDPCKEQCNSYYCPTEICREGCYCKEGYKRDDNGNCVPQENCPSCTGRHEVYSNCGSRCAESCNKNQFCTLQCTPGCFCKAGFARNSNGICVPECECTFDCKDQNEVFKLDGNPCTDGCNRDLVRCMYQSIAGCYCKDGYARESSTRKCVPYPCTSS